MDADRFDLFVRALAVSPSRRLFTRVMTGLTGLSVAGGLGALVGQGDAEAKKKKRRKKKKRKKKCKGKKKCGKKCIPTTSCCTSTECGGGATCQNGACHCPSGQKVCQGACIPEDDCCPACVGDQTCEGGECICPPFTIPCGDECIDDFLCCSASDCGGTQACVDHVCTCTGADELFCGVGNCCTIGSEVCYFDRTGQSGTHFCQGGGCPATDLCNVLDAYLCDVDCLCTTTVDPSPANACVDATASIDCTSCTSSAQCAAGSVCMRGNELPGVGFCLCDNNFCIPLCQSGALRSEEAHRDPQHKPALLIGAKSQASGGQRGGKRTKRERHKQHGQ